MRAALSIPSGIFATLLRMDDRLTIGLIFRCKRTPIGPLPTEVRATTNKSPEPAGHANKQGTEMRPPPAGLLATMRSPNVSHALERITGVFKGSAQRQIILQLSNALQEISAQELLAAADRTRRAPVSELVMASGAVRNPIRENRVHPLEDILQTRRKEGMVLMDNCLYNLSCKSLISYDTAVSRARPRERITRSSARPPAECSGRS